MYEKLKAIRTKGDARQFAIEWQSWASEESFDYLCLIVWGSVFTKLGKRFGLLKEFKENGII